MHFVDLQRFYKANNLQNEQFTKRTIYKNNLQKQFTKTIYKKNNLQNEQFTK